MTDPHPPPFLTLEAALREFATATSTQSQQHIRPIHSHVALRLALEGGFHPDEITPHPPLGVETRAGRQRLIFDPGAEKREECTVLGGLKSKSVDVVVSKAGVGPVLAVSVKGTGNAFRNLTNRMEEAIGDSTNLHIMYPGLVYGFLHFLKANQQGQAELSPNDVAITENGEVVSAIRRYHDVLMGLAGRRLVRNDYTRYEAVALALVIPHGKSLGQIYQAFPPVDSPLHVGKFFDRLYATYDLRFPYVGASMTALRRHEWAPESPAFQAIQSSGPPESALGYHPRTG